jgi:hypothetical protein
MIASHRIASLVAACLLVGCGAADKPTATNETPGGGGVVKTWRGHFLIPAIEPGEHAATVPARVIRDQAGYDAFVAMIPAERVQKKQPAPPSDDPLLAKPPIDFATHALVVGFRTDTMEIGALAVETATEAGELRVRFDAKDLGDAAMAARRSDVGAYLAVLVETGGREIVAD